MELAIQAADLRYRYPDGQVGIDGVTLSIPRGETVALLGANGTGKSTFLLCLVGILLPEGQAEIFGVPVRPPSLREIRRRVGYAFQNPDDQLFSPTVEEDVSFGPLELGWPPERAGEACRRALGLVGLPEHAPRNPHSLSFGEKRRVALATVLAMEPELLLLDEPTSGLDPGSASAMIDVLEELSCGGRTIVLTTHDLHLAGELAHRVVIFGASRQVVANGTPEEILSRASLLEENHLVHRHRHRHAAKVHSHPHRHEVHHEDKEGSKGEQGRAGESKG